jgi:apolipoprotein N-acyltransferase
MLSLKRFLPAPSYALAALLGALAVPGFAPLGWFPLPILSLAGLFWLAADVAPKRAFRLGWAYGLGLFLAGVSWVYVSISTYGGMPAPIAALATLLFCAFVALFPALALGLGARLSGPGCRRSALALPAAWVLGEWTRGWIFTGFPWLALGYSQVPDSPLAGYAPVLGVYGVSLLAALSAGLLTLLLLPPAGGRGSGGEGKARFPGLTALATIWLSAWALQHVDWTRPTPAPVSVTLLQGNIPQDMKFRPEKLDATLRHYARAVLASESRLIVLPETALPLFRSSVPRDYLDLLRDHARARNGDVVLGIPEDDGPERYYNSVMTLGGSPEGMYRKVHLVPFGEFVPFGFRWAVNLMSIPLGDFSLGERKPAPPGRRRRETRRQRLLRGCLRRGAHRTRPGTPRFWSTSATTPGSAPAWPPGSTSRSAPCAPWRPAAGNCAPTIPASPPSWTTRAGYAPGWNPSPPAP